MAEVASDRDTPAVWRMALEVLQSRLQDSRQLSDEFRTVLQRDQQIRHSFSAAQEPANAAKNRYVNVLPYDHNRVPLRPCCDVVNAGAPAALTNGTRSGGSAAAAPSTAADYINASYVVHDDPAYGIYLRYIACQGPLSATVADFWRMCWCEGVGAVVMLTNTVERGVTKCSPYYPTQPDARLALRPSAAAPSPPCVAEVVATWSRSLHGGDLTHTRLQLRPPQGGGGGGASAAGAAAGPREVSHLRYNAWPDHGTPADASAIRTLCDMLHEVRDAGGAVVVHCSAGIGRTGTFVAIDVLRRRLQALAARGGAVDAATVQATLDLPELVHSLRRQRCGMVQTLEQYVFCYQAVYEELAAAAQAAAGPGVSTPPRGRR